jgi:sugar O-acyltransferase (sialic acid O-acetyltransferase NeuD family)
MIDVFLLGNSITAEIILAYLESDKRFNVIGLTVEDGFENGGLISHLPTIPLSKICEEFDPSKVRFIPAIGYNDVNRNRERIFCKIELLGYSAQSYIHPDARVYTNLPIGPGSVILANAVVEPFVKIGRDSFVWSNSTIAHHSQVGDHCWISSGAVISGKATLKNNVFVGVNATIVDQVTIEDYCIIGGGAFVSKCTSKATVHLTRSAEQLRFSSTEYDKHFGI